MKRVLRPQMSKPVLGRSVAGIVGGLHYGEQVTPAVEEGIALLAERDPALVALSPHDAGRAGLSAFETALAESYHRIAVYEPIVVR